MSALKPSDDNSERLEQIVAYLDGELSPVDSALVEQQLGADEDFRHELQSIDRAWAALDELPETVVDDKFLQTTMDLVVDSAQREIAEKTQAMPVIRRNRLLTKMLLGLVATLLGVLAYRLVWSNPNRVLLSDLPVINQLFIYSQFEQVDFLRMLNEQVKDDWPLTQEQLVLQHQEVQLIADSENRRQWLTDLSDDQRVTLRANYNRYRSMSLLEQERLRKLHQQIEASPDREELQQTLLQYEHWLNNLSTSDQYNLRNMPPGARAQEVAVRVKKLKNDISIKLSSKELKQFWSTFEPRIRKQIGKMRGDFSEEELNRFKQLQKVDFRRVFTLILSRWTPEQIEERLSPVILEALPEHVRPQFENLKPQNKIRQLAEWRHQYSNQSGKPSQQELEDFFVEDLDPDEKERLLALSHDQMQRQLERMYRGVSSLRDRRGPPGYDRLHPPRRGPARLEEFRKEFRRGDRPRPGDRRPGRRLPNSDHPPGPPPPLHDDNA